MANPIATSTPQDASTLPAALVPLADAALPLLVAVPLPPLPLPASEADVLFTDRRTTLELAPSFETRYLLCSASSAASCWPKPVLPSFSSSLHRFLHSAASASETVHRLAAAMALALRAG